MRIVVTGATGNVGTSVLEALGRDERVDSVLALSRRRLGLRYPKVVWSHADVARDDLAQVMRGADVVIHLAWLIQPGRDEATTRATNVDGSRRVFEAVARAEVPALIYASSVGAYSPGPKDRAVDENWPTGGIDSSFYSRHKAEVERILDRLERENPRLRCARLRPGLIFKREAATEIRRLFAGPFLPNFLMRPRFLPVVPDIPGLVFQAVHSLDVGDAYLRASTSESASGAFNIAAEPVLTADEIARALQRPNRCGARRSGPLAGRHHLPPAPPAHRAGMARYGAEGAGDEHGPREARARMEAAAGRDCHAARAPGGHGRRRGAGLPSSGPVYKRPTPHTRAAHRARRAFHLGPLVGPARPYNAKRT